MAGNSQGYRVSLATGLNHRRCLLSPQPPVRVGHRLVLPSHLLFLSSVFTSMSSVFAQYESFLVAHVSTISSLESTLRSITWILPGRFKDAELASEAR